MIQKIRADILLVDQGLVESRAKGQALIMANLVSTDSRKIEKPGQLIPKETVLKVKGRDHPWVSRGGVKLAHALDYFSWDVHDTVALDIGASTGGFTDVLLHRGARRVYAVDVGHGQLAWSLRQDARVLVMEKTNARHLTQDHIPEQLDLIVCDASFIPLRLVLPKALDLARQGARIVALVKPQFEVQPEEVGKGGVVRDSDIHRRVCTENENFLSHMNWKVAGLTPSPIKGPKGNVEFLLAAEKTSSGLVSI